MKEVLGYEELKRQLKQRSLTDDISSRDLHLAMLAHRCTAEDILTQLGEKSQEETATHTVVEFRPAVSPSMSNLALFRTKNQSPSNS